MRRKVVVALAVGLLFYALSDILLWQRIFEAHDLFLFDAQYQSGHITVLVALIATGMVLLYDARLWALWYGLAFYTLAFSGLEDILYYWLAGKPIVHALPWLNDNSLIFFKPVTSEGLLVNAALWLGFWAVSLWLIPKVERLIAQLAGLSRELLANHEARSSL
jgi:hypothetical protein